MTREEAIKYAKRAVELGLNDETQAFCEVVIKALEQEPCKDCISRKAALECCRNEWEEEVEERLKSLPPVIPLQNVGNPDRSGKSEA